VQLGDISIISSGNGTAAMIAMTKQGAPDYTTSPFGDNVSTTAADSTHSRSVSSERANCSSSLFSETSSAKTKRRHRKASRAWGKNANVSSGNNASSSSLPPLEPDRSRSSSKDPEGSSSTKNCTCRSGVNADDNVADQTRMRRSAFATSPRIDSERSEMTHDGTSSTAEMTATSTGKEQQRPNEDDIRSSQASHHSSTGMSAKKISSSDPHRGRNNISHEERPPTSVHGPAVTRNLTGHFNQPNNGGNRASASSSICSSMHSSTLGSVRSSQSYNSRHASTMAGGPDVHHLAIAHEFQEDVVDELEEELFVLAQKTRAALNDSHAEVDVLRRENDDALKILNNMEAEHRSLLDEKRKWEGQSLVSSAAGEYKMRSVGRRSSGPGIVVTSGGANYKSGNIKMGAPAPTSDLFQQLTGSTGSITGDAPAARDRPLRLQVPKGTPSFLNRFSSALASENDANHDQGSIRNVSIRRQSAISVLSSDEDEDDEDLMRSLSTFDIANTEDKGEQDQGSGRGWRSLRASFSTSVSNLLVNLNSEGEIFDSSVGKNNASSQRSPSSLEISLQNQLRHLRSERKSAVKRLDAQLQEAISVENGLIKTQVTQKDELNDIRLKISDLKINRNLAKSKAQDEIIDLQTQMSNLTRSIDEKVGHLQASEIEESRPNKALREEEKKLKSELLRILRESEALQCGPPD